MSFADNLKYNSDGLIPAIIQDVDDNTVLMMAYMNKDAVIATLETGKTNFWSRSRQKYWIKGESSGHIQEVKEIFYDCDADTLLIKVKQHGGACHVGYRSCFYTKVNKDGSTETVGEKVFDPDQIYKK
ncbi:MAG: phosphoribosyl-AMP cyclohydrolase [Candidatus Auribacterota bacterium]|jgi:phosphoribosyl-AMP cyclohydrolase|nr:phosphoribosyl-AMP cyclohydrolase [Candidatus Auribacterota bacterium]